MNYQEVKALADEALEKPTATEIEQLIQAFCRKIVKLDTKTEFYVKILAIFNRWEIKMGLFDKLFGSKKIKQWKSEIYAPLSGEIVNIEDVPDVVFSEKIVGDGIAIRPTGNKIVAPVDGVIGKIFETNHAFSMESKEGVELFVHFGIDTVGLKGEGFTRIAQEGQSVKRGDTVIEFDLVTLESKAKSVLTPVVISNMDEISSIEKNQVK